MKLNKKIVVVVVGILVGVTSVIFSGFSNSNVVTAVSSSAVKTSVKLRLNHNAYIYDKNGKRLKKYKGKKALIKKSKTVTLKGTINPIYTAKRYYFYVRTNNNSAPYWLTYKKIRGNYYYSIGSKGYIKCINVSKVNGNTLIESQATVIVKPQIGKVAYAINSSGYIKSKTFKKGQKLVVDDTDIFLEGLGYSYHVKGTDYWINARDLKANPRPSNNVTSVLKFNGVAQK